MRFRATSQNGYYQINELMREKEEKKGREGKRRREKREKRKEERRGGKRKSAGKDMERKEDLYPVDGNINHYRHYGKQ